MKTFRKDSCMHETSKPAIVALTHEKYHCKYFMFFSINKAQITLEIVLVHFGQKPFPFASHCIRFSPSPPSKSNIPLLDPPLTVLQNPKTAPLSAPRIRARSPTPALVARPKSEMGHSAAITDTRLGRAHMNYFQ